MATRRSQVGRRECMFFVALVVLATAAGASGESAAADAIVRRVQERYDSTEDLQAAVEQELVFTSAGRSVSAAGSMAFKRPGKMRWVMQNGESQIIVADGETLWFFQPEEQQVLKAPFRAAFRSTAPISFLTGVGRISDDFEVDIEGRDEERVYLTLRPRADAAEVGRLKLTIDAASYDIVGAEIVDLLGNITRLRFSDLRRNTGLADSLFRFQIPPGVDVIEAPIGY